MNNMKDDPNSTHIYYYYQTVDTKEIKQVPLMTDSDLIGIFGGTLGLFLGFSFFGCISSVWDYISVITAKLSESGTGSDVEQQ